MMQQLYEGQGLPTTSSFRYVSVAFYCFNYLESIVFMTPQLYESQDLPTTNSRQKTELVDYRLNIEVKCYKVFCFYNHLLKLK